MVSGIVYTHPDKPRQLFVNEIGVADAYQRMGVGRRLLEGILEHARGKGCIEAWIGTEEGNAPARACASASGLEDPERAVVYTWNLGGRDSVA